MGMEEKLSDDLKEAMRAGDEVRKMTIRSVKAAISEAKVAGDVARSLTEEEVNAIIIKQAKQRRDSIEEFTKGNRPDLAAKEQAELKILEQYLPRQLGEEEIRERARAVIGELNVKDIKGIGAVMRRLTGDLRGQADGQTINRVVRELLA
jgi:hypothetical protein